MMYVENNDSDLQAFYIYCYRNNRNNVPKQHQNFIKWIRWVEDLGSLCCTNVMTLMNPRNFCRIRNSLISPPAYLSRTTPNKESAFRWGWFIQKTGSNAAFPTSLPQACIISIKVCRQWPSCCKQSCPRRVIAVSIDGRSVLDMLEAINVFFIWELQIQK